MKFLITMNMPVRTRDKVSQAQLVHQVIVEHRSESLEDFRNLLNEQEFVLVEEFYKDDSGYFSVGKMILNTSHIGKIKVVNNQGE
jgi:hypothetical protein